MHSSIIYICQDMEATEVAINRCRDKEDVVYKYTMEYYSAIKKSRILPFAKSWMNLQDVMIAK